MVQMEKWSRGHKWTVQANAQINLNHKCTPYMLYIFSFNFDLEEAWFEYVAAGGKIFCSTIWVIQLYFLLSFLQITTV